MAGEPRMGHPQPEPCGAYLGDNDATCPQLTCIRPKGHAGLHDNVRAADDACQECGGRVEYVDGHRVGYHGPLCSECPLTHPSAEKGSAP